MFIGNRIFILPQTVTIEVTVISPVFWTIEYKLMVYYRKKKWKTIAAPCTRIVIFSIFELEWCMLLQNTPKEALKC